ncbi:abscission/NoCut checkpoint regulator isoform X2 [Malaya genurostris]|uniref:abscission/NoCut checkpoint regulator isoform X2 n=1 Tax=Malaya genurostris TaxID=325434 RepID=UPI0026F39E8E|nr:abscission/NoCut checkpoint regulator isoform X2 [Malaya genurostris]
MGVRSALDCYRKKFRSKEGSKNNSICLRCHELLKNDQKGVTVSKCESYILDAPIESGTSSVIKPTVAHMGPTNDSDVDSQIRKRLLCLKEKTHGNESTYSAATVSDIEKRLAELKGIEYKDYTESNKRFLLQKDNRTQEEQIRDIMKQFTEEQDMLNAVSNYRLTEIDEIGKRLAQLKDDSYVKINPAHNIAQEESEDETIETLTRKYIEEAAIDAKNHSNIDDELSTEDIPEPLDPSELKELPWCTICNENADVRCMSCGGDLFCHSCFKECHNDDEEYRTHRKKSFNAYQENNS